MTRSAAFADGHGAWGMPWRMFASLRYTCNSLQPHAAGPHQVLAAQQAAAAQPPSTRAPGCTAWVPSDGRALKRHKSHFPMKRSHAIQPLLFRTVAVPKPGVPALAPPGVLFGWRLRAGKNITRFSDITDEECWRTLQDALYPVRSSRRPAVLRANQLFNRRHTARAATVAAGYGDVAALHQPIRASTGRLPWMPSRCEPAQIVKTQ